MSKPDTQALLYQEQQGEPPPWLRAAVHGVLSKSNGFQQLSQAERKHLAKAMVKISAAAAKLIAEENVADLQLPEKKQQAADAVNPESPPVLAVAQSAPNFGESANRIASVTRSVLNAVSFPRFVTDLVNGVFQAMLDSSSQQMQMYVELLNNVSASVEGFEQTQFSTRHVRAWLVDHFPDAIEFEAVDEDDADPGDVEEARIRLRSGARMPGEDQLRTVFGISPEESISAGNPEQLVPLARRQIARQRQQMLATMVTMGMQRIVIDSGRINASMRFHIDTRSAANEDRGTEFGMQNRVRAAGRFGAGPWGVSAEVENNISYVSTQRNQQSEEINTDLELNSSVELNFRTDYLPLNQMAAQAQADRIRQASLNPDASPENPANARAARIQAQRAAESDRANRLNMTPPAASATPLVPPTPETRSTTPAPSTATAPSTTSTAPAPSTTTPTPSTTTTPPVAATA